MNRREFLVKFGSGVLNGSVIGEILADSSSKSSKPDDRPNIFFTISDDQSWVHTGVMGDRVVKTPTFDRVAEEGANLWSTLPAKFKVYPDILEAAGYHVGFMGKGWGPGQFEPGGRIRERFRCLRSYLMRQR